MADTSSTQGSPTPPSGFASAGAGQTFSGGNTRGDDDLAGGATKEALQGRFDKHEKGSRWAHRILWFAILILLLLIGRSFIESILLRQSNNDLRDAVEAQTLAISQTGTVAPVLGGGLAPPGTILEGEDGQLFICPAGPEGEEGVTGTIGPAGPAGLPGGPGFSVTAGNGLSDSDPSANVVLDLNISRGLAISTDFLRVLGADGTILVTNAGVRVGLIGDANINSGFGAGQFSAVDTLIADAGDFYLSGEVEGALQEAGPVVAAGLQSIDDTYANFGAASPTITVDAAEGQVGNLIFDLTTTQDIEFQDAGTAFALFDDSGDVTFFNDLGVGAPAGAETLSNVGFFPDGDDQFIADTLGVEDTIYTDSGLTVGASTIYSDGSIATTAFTSDLSITTVAGVGAGDVDITTAGDITLAPTGADVLANDLLTITTGTGLDDPSLRLVNSATPETVELIAGPTDPTGGVTAPAGSLYLRDTAGADGGELYVKFGDAATEWIQAATVTSTTLDDAYDNFAASAADIAVDGTEGQGPLTFNLTGEDFVIEQSGSPFATFDDTTGLSITSTNASDALNISQSFGDNSIYTTHTSTGTNVQFEKDAVTGTNLYIWNSNVAAAGRAYRVDDDSLVQNIGAEITWADDELEPNTDVSGFNGSTPLSIVAENETLSLVSDSATERAAIVEVGAHDTGAAFNYIAFNSDIDGDDGGSDAEFRVDGSGATFADGAYSAAGADYAEYFRSTNPDLSPGELVAVDVDSSGSVRRTNGSDDSPIGVISSNPGFIGNTPLGLSEDEVSESDVLVGLTGQLKTYVTDENGAVGVGDYITASSEPGQGRKANPGEATLGVALTGVDEDGMATILVAPAAGSLAIDPDSNLQALSGEIENIKLGGEQTFKDLTVLNKIAAEGISVISDLEVNGQIVAGSIRVDGDATFHGDVEINNHLSVGSDTAGEVTIEQGSLSARIDFDSEYDEAPLIQLTPQDFAPHYRLENVTAEGFIVAIENTSDKDLTFNWLAVGKADGVPADINIDQVTDEEVEGEEEPEKTSWFQKIIDLARR